jgi:hypothetical protein
MKQLKLFSAGLLVLLFASCSHYVDDPNKSVWSEWLWVIPWLTGLGAIVFFILAYRSVKNSSIDNKTGNINYSNKFSFSKTGFFWFGVGLLIATIWIIWDVNRNR